MPVLLVPAALAAFAAVAVPLLIHLARRTETRPLDFAALRWLREKPRPRHRPRFDEWPLLLVRMTLLLLLALWLARPVLTDAADRTPVMAFVPGLTAATGEGRRVLLAPGFPDIAAPAERGGPVGSLMRQLDAELPAGVPLTLVVPERLDGLDAERPHLSRAVTWRIVPGRAPVPDAVPGMGASPDVAIRYAPDYAGAARYLRAATAAWTPAGGRSRVDAAPLGRPLPGGVDHILWLADGAVPPAVRRRVAAGATALLVRGATASARWTVGWRDDAGRPVAGVAALGRGRLVRMARDMNPAALPMLLDPGFPTQLRAVLAPLPPPAMAMARNHRPATGGMPPIVPAQDLRPLLALGIALLWLGERWLATRRGRGVTP